MLRKKVIKLITLLRVYKSRLLGLAGTYFLVTEVGFRLPYFNLYTFDFGWRLFVLYILAIVWIRPSYNFLIFTSIFFLILGNFGEVMGILIYLSLLVALIKYFISLRKIKNA